MKRMVFVLFLALQLHGSQKTQAQHVFTMNVSKKRHESIFGTNSNKVHPVASVEKLIQYNKAAEETILDDERISSTPRSKGMHLEERCEKEYLQYLQKAERRNQNYDVSNVEAENESISCCCFGK